MTTPDDRDFQRWARDWQQAGPRDIATEEQIRHYVKRRGDLVWVWLATELAVGGVALPILAYFGWMARSDVERFAMLGLGLMTVAAMCFSWWNWRGALRFSAATTAEYLAISAERLRRLRVAWRVTWVVLAGEVLVLTIWIWDHFYWRTITHDAADETWAWGWLVGFSLAAVLGLIWFGRWLTRDEARFERLRKELE